MVGIGLSRRARSRASFVVACVAMALPLAGSSPAVAAVGSDTILTVAGTGQDGDLGDGFDARQAAFRFTYGIGVAANGDVYVADYKAERVRRIDATGAIVGVAGTGKPGPLGDGGPATQATLNHPTRLAFDAAGNLYIADTDNHRVRRVDTAGTITTVAGNGEYGTDGLGGPATEAQLRFPGGMAVAPDGSLYITDYDRVLRVDPAGVMTLFAGASEPTGDGDGGPATEAAISTDAIALDPHGNVLLADNATGRVRKVDQDGIITTISPPDQQYNYLTGIGLDAAGNIYFGGIGDHKVFRMDPAGTVSVVAGTGQSPLGAPDIGDGGSAGAARVELWGFAVDPQGALYLGEGDRIRTVRRVGPERLVLTHASSPALPLAGSTVTLTYTAKNYAPDAATGVKVVDALPAGVAFVPGTSPGCKLSGSTVTCTVGRIDPGAAKTVTITLKTLQAGELRNVATASSTEAEPYAKNNTVVSRMQVSAAQCGKVITQDKALGVDLGPCAGTAMVIGADNVTIDLKGHRVFGFAGPSGFASDAAGVQVENRTGVTIRNGEISQFDAGVYLLGGGSHTLTGLVVHDNVGADNVFTSLLGDGIFVERSAGNRIVGNTLSRNGTFDGIGIYEPGSNDNVVENNTIEGTLGPADGGPAGAGIQVNGTTGTSSATHVSNNRIAANVVRDNGSGGIANLNHVNGQIIANTVLDNGFRNSNGNGIGIQVGLAWNPATLLNALVEGNEVHGNGNDGIQVRRRAGGVTVRSNNAAGNGLRGGLDLRDQNADCGTNTWRNNTWGPAGFNPECTSLEGQLATAWATAAAAAANDAVTPTSSSRNDDPPARGRKRP